MEHAGNNALSGGGMYGGYGYSLGNLLGAFIVLLVKLLLIVLVVVVILAIAAWIRDNVFKNNSSKIVQVVNQDPVLKIVAVTTATILGLILLLALVGNLAGPNMGGGNQFGGGMNYGYNPGLGIAGLMMTLVQVLTIIFVLSLIIAAVVYVSTQYSSGNLNIFPKSQPQEATAGNMEPSPMNETNQ